MTRAIEMTKDCTYLGRGRVAAPPGLYIDHSSHFLFSMENATLLISNILHSFILTVWMFYEGYERYTERERLSVLIRFFFFPFYIGDGRIASSMVVYHFTIFCY